MFPISLLLTLGASSLPLDLGVSGASLVVGVLGAGAIGLWIVSQMRSSRRRRWATEVACAVRSRDIRRLEKLSDYEVIRARRVVVRGGDAEPVQVDGDVLARLPATFEVDAVPVRLMVPG